MSFGGLFANCGTWRDGIDEEGSEATPEEDNVVEGVAAGVKSPGFVCDRGTVWFRRELIPETFVGVGVHCGWPKTGIDCFKAPSIASACI